MSLEIASPSAAELPHSLVDHTAKRDTAPTVAAPEKTVEVISYFSPVVRFDKEVHATVLQFRDTTTGEVIRQFPALPAVYGATRGDAPSLHASA